MTAEEKQPVELISSFHDRAEKFDQEMKWKVCQFCREEWTKLKLCSFYWNGKKDMDSMCVRCAETVRSINGVAEKYPIPEIEIDMSFNGISKHSFYLKGRMFIEFLDRNRIARLKFLNLVILIESVGTNLRTTVGEDNPIHFNNILQSWSFVEKCVSSFRSPESLA